MPSLARLPVGAVLRAAAVCAALAGLVAVAGPSAYFACIPAALLLAASARGAAGSTAAVVATVAAASAPPVAGDRPSPLLALALAGASVAVLHAVRTRLEGEREAMRASALRDPLTGTSNRRGLDERIEYEVARHSRERRRFCVVALDLDGFKAVNDRFGHPAGDELLRDVADALRGAVREQDTVARLGGDEFCVLAPETGRTGGHQLALKISKAVGRVTTGLDAMSASVGVGVFPDDGRTALAVLEAADAAQVEAKRRSRRQAA